MKKHVTQEMPRSQNTAISSLRFCATKLLAMEHKWRQVNRGLVFREKKKSFTPQMWYGKGIETIVSAGS